MKRALFTSRLHGPDDPVVEEEGDNYRANGAHTRHGTRS